MRRATWIAGVLVCVGCASGGHEDSGALGRATQALTTSVAVDATMLSANPSGAITVRLFGDGGTSVAFAGARTLSLPDDHYVVADYAYERIFGAFTISGGAIIATEGALTTTSGGLAFDTTKLTRLHVPAPTLSTGPAQLVGVRLSDLTGGFTSDMTVYLPDGHYSITDYVAQHVFGTFTIALGAVTADGGAVLVDPAGGLAFDLAALARVTFKTAELTTPQGLLAMRLGAGVSGGWAGTPTMYLPEGTYDIGDYDAVHRYGGFTVTGTTISATDGAAFVDDSGAIAFDRSKLAHVHVRTSELSSIPGLVGLRLGSVSGGFAADPDLYLPSGTYRIGDYDASHTWGDFTVSGTSIVSTTGSARAVGEDIGFDHDALAAVRFAVSDASTPAGLLSFRLGSTTGGFAGAATLWLPDGAYTLSDYSQVHAFGRLDVHGTTFTTSAPLRVNADGALALDGCAMTRVEITVASGRSAALSLVTGYFGNTAVFPLPDGDYSFAGDAATFHVGGGAVTSSIPAGSAVTSITSKPCVEPPRVTCVGTADAPVRLAGACSIDVVATSGAAGSCAGGGGGLQSCTYDGVASETLGAGVHAISVVGTANDGSSASCTSWVEVPACATPPQVTCVGTDAARVPIPMTAGACTATVAVADAIAGSCTHASSCTYDGLTSLSLGGGAHDVTVAAASDDGTSASCTSAIRVVDDQPPTIACPASHKIECTAAKTSVAVAATCADNCGCNVACALPAGFPLGETTVACAASDAAGARASCTTKVTVVDTTAPSATLTVSPTTLWSPSHALIPITIDMRVTDACDPAPVVRCNATSSEPALGGGSGATPADVVWVDGKLFLRAERAGTGTGRVYTITCTATDASGNAVSKSATVTVPH